MSTTASGSKLEGLENELLADIAGAVDLAGLEQVRIAVLGKKGRISELMQTRGSLAPEERKGFGQAVNETKARVTDALEARKARIEDELFRLRSDQARQGTQPQILRYESELRDVSARLRDLEKLRDK